MAREAFPHDGGLPQLARAFDTRLMAGLLRRELRAAGDATLESVTLEGFRHRPGTRGVIKYRAQGGRSDGRPVWLTGVVYGEPGRARARAEKARAPEAWDEPWAPVAFIEELDMAVEVFPFDRRLPSLAALAAGPEQALADELGERAGVPAQAPGRWTSEVARYRPQLGAVLRWTLHDDDGAVARRFYVKVYGAGESEEAARRLERTADATRGFATCRPVAHLPEQRALVMPEVPGVPLDRLLLRDADASGAVRQAARALATFHQTSELPERRFGRDDELAKVRRACAHLHWARPDVGRTVTGILAAITRTLAEVPPCAAHLDLKPDHILVLGSRTALVDLDSAAAADPVIDAATLLARLYGLPFEQRLPHARADAAVRAFALEYFARVPAGWRARLEPHYAGALLELAASLFRRQVPGWQDAVAALVAEAADAAGSITTAGRARCA